MRVTVAPAVRHRLCEVRHFDIQSTAPKSHCVNTTRQWARLWTRLWTRLWARLWAPPWARLRYFNQFYPRKSNSQYKDHLIVHFTRNGRVNKTNFYHMQVLLQFPKGNAFKPELRRANSCIRSLWAVKRPKFLRDSKFPH